MKFLLYRVSYYAPEEGWARLVTACFHFDGAHLLSFLRLIWFKVELIDYSQPEYLSPYLSISYTGLVQDHHQVVVFLVTDPLLVVACVVLIVLVTIVYLHLSGFGDDKKLTS